MTLAIEVLIPLFLCLALIAAALSPRPGRLLVVQIPLLVGTAVLAFLLTTGLPGRPRNALVMSDNVEEATVLWARVGEVGTEMLLEWPGSGSPILFWWPSDPSAEQELKQAMRDANSRGRPLRIRHPFRMPWQPEESGGGQGRGNGEGRGATGVSGMGRGPRTIERPEGEPRFYTAPPPPLPPKGYSS